MNLYFWGFAVYALLITPVTVRVRLQYHNGFHWQAEFFAVGFLVFVLHRKRAPKPKATFINRFRKLRMIWNDQPALQFLRCLHLQQVHIRARISFEDAAATALAFAFLRTVLQTLDRCSAVHGKVSADLQADFGFQPSLAQLTGIFTCRMGSLALACIRLARNAARTQAMLEEEQYAAASH